MIYILEKFDLSKKKWEKISSNEKMRYLAIDVMWEISEKEHKYSQYSNNYYFKITSQMNENDSIKKIIAIDKGILYHFQDNRFKEPLCRIMDSCVKFSVAKSPGKLYNEIAKMTNIINSWIFSIDEKFWDVINDLLTQWIHDYHDNIGFDYKISMKNINWMLYYSILKSDIIYLMILKDLVSGISKPEIIDNILYFTSKSSSDIREDVLKKTKSIIKKYKSSKSEIEDMYNLPF